MFDRYYQVELSYLRQLGAEFARARPELAPLLAERGNDPDVERLLEGFAFLTGRVQQRIDALLPELVQALMEWLAPQLLRPVPSAAVLELTPLPGGARGPTRVDAGSEVLSRPVDGVRCRFRTAWPVTALPLSVAALREDSGLPYAPSLRLELKLARGGRAALAEAGELELFLHGEAPLTQQLLLWFARHLRHVRLERGDETLATLPSAQVELSGFDPARSLWPWPGAAPRSLCTLGEYFSFPEKFSFVRLRGLAALSLPEELDSLALVFQFDRPPPLPTRVPDDALRLHCVPAVNLFQVDAEPFVADERDRPQLLRASGLAPRQAEVFSVDEVTATPTSGGARRRVHAYHAFRAGDAEGDLFYHVTRRRSPVDDGVHTLLGLETPVGRAPRRGAQTVSATLTCTNRSLAGGLAAGDIVTPTASTPAGLRVRNVTVSSRQIRPPIGERSVWRLLGQLVSARRPLSEPRALKELLHVYNLQRGGDHPRASANESDIEAIRELRAQPTTRVERGVPVRGTLTELELDQGRFATEGAAFLFGAVLDELLACRAGVNGFSALRATLKPSGYELTWPARLP